MKYIHFLLNCYELPLIGYIHFLLNCYELPLIGS